MRTTAPMSSRAAACAPVSAGFTTGSSSRAPLRTLSKSVAISNTTTNAIAPNHGACRPSHQARTGGAHRRHTPSRVAASAHSVPIAAPASMSVG